MGLKRVLLAVCLIWVALPSKAQSARDIQELRERLALQEARLAGQERELQLLRAALDQQKSLLDRWSAGQVPSSSALRPSPPRQLPGAQSANSSAASPLTMRIGSFDVTPGGFLDLTTSFRTTSVGSGIATNFNSLPFSNTPAGRLSETRESAQNSRITLRATANLNSAQFTGFLETDFLGFQPANGVVSSNSNGPRMRLLWVNVRKGRWEWLAGQSYSFLTPNRNGLSPEPRDMFLTQAVDPNFHVGLTWTRAPQIRLVFHPNASWSIGLAAENPEQFIGNGVVLPPALREGYAAQVDNGSLPNPSATPNLHPDLLPKIAYDRHMGNHPIHIEAVGLFRSFRVFNPLLEQRYRDTGFGGSLNLSVGITRRLSAMVNTFASRGGGRYIFGLGPDLVIRPDGSPSPVRSGSGLAGLEYQARSNTLLYGYYGGVYFDRSTGVDAAGVVSGYGFQGGPNSANRAIQQGTIGILRRVWNARQFGTFQINTQLSYVTRSPWWVTPGQPAHAHTTQVYLGLRYVAP